MDDVQDADAETTETTENTQTAETTEAQDEQQALDFYQKLRLKIRKQLENKTESGKGPKYDAFVEMLAVLPDLFHLAVKCLFDKKIPIENKGALVVAVAYVISPIDLVPDLLPIIGWLDDLIVITMAMNKFLELDKPEVREAVTEHWAGEGEVLETIKHVLAVGDEAIDFLPKRLMSMIRNMFS